MYGKKAELKEANTNHSRKTSCEGSRDGMGKMVGRVLQIMLSMRNRVQIKNNISIRYLTYLKLHMVYQLSQV